MFRTWFPWVSAALASTMVLLSIPELVEWNNDENYLVVEYPSGAIEVFDTAGWHPQMFGEVFTYPRYVDTYYSNEDGEGDDAVDSSIRLTFNDGGWGHTSNHLRFQMPITSEQRIALHRHFGMGEEKDVTAAVGHHLMNCLKNAGPLMSASEHQAQKKSEFYQVVLDQLTLGLFVMERVEQKVDRGIDREKGDDTDVVFLTKIKRDKDGNPVIAAPSPLKEYGITVVQYNQTGTVYDADTIAQINAKREAYQLGEQAKAATLNEQQKLLEAIEQGKLDVADAEAKKNKEVKASLVAVLRDQDVAKVKQTEDVTVAEQEVVVAGEKLKQAKTELEISVIKVEQAKAEAATLIAESEATRAKLEQGGAISERDQVIANLKQRMQSAAAKAISQIPAPRIVIIGAPDGKAANGVGGESQSTTSTLMNLLMLQQLDGKQAANK